jgi:hypothetical protein
MNAMRNIFAILMLCAALAPPSAFAEDSWSLQPTPNAGGSSDPNHLYAVECAPESATACTAVGTRTSAGVDSPVAHRWNGAFWSEQAAAKKSGATHTRLFGVDCPSETRCLAVGNYQSSEGSTVLSEIWNEGKWNVQTTPTPSEATSSEFVAVGCNSTANCTAVGSAVIGGVKKAIAERWTSPTWALSSIPIPEGATSSQLDGVDCLWSNFCVAVGRYTTSGGSIKSLIVFWNGTNWSLQTATDPAGAVQTTLLDVACTPTPNRCTAVGGWKNSAGEQFTLAYRFNGVTTWTLQSTPNPSGSIASVLQDVSCATETSCGTAGSWVSGSGGSNKTLAENWNGTSWSIQGTLDPTGNSFSAFFGVTCRTQSDACIGVGYSTQSGVDRALSELRTHWAIKTTPHTEGAFDDRFSEVNCEPNSITVCMAVGGSFFSVTNSPLLARWNGTEWISEASNLKGAEAEEALFQGSWCASTTSCLAVGSYGNGSPLNTLAEKWGGTSWSSIPPKNPSPEAYNHLSKVACSSTTECTAVGGYVAGVGEWLPLAERWNGTSWTVQTVPLPAGASDAELYGIQCRTATFCMAVGESSGESGGPFAATWNGSSWSSKAIAMPENSAGGWLVDVGCIATNECVAVGQFYESGFSFGAAARPLVARWNGTSWSLETVPLPMGSAFEHWYSLSNVSCASATSCTAVGNYEEQEVEEKEVEEVKHPYVVTWNGSSWKYQLTPLSSDAIGAALSGVSCRGTKCVAVGAKEISGHFERTLGMVYNPE